MALLQLFLTGTEFIRKDRQGPGPLRRLFDQANGVDKTNLKRRLGQARLGEEQEKA